MKVWTLWEEGLGGDMPWLVDAYDEYTLDSNGEVPEAYQAKFNENPNRRELVLDIPEGAVSALFKPTVIKAAVWVSPEAAADSRRRKQDEDDGA